MWRCRCVRQRRRSARHRRSSQRHADSLAADRRAQLRRPGNEEERRRAALARAIAFDPALLILEQPFDGLTARVASELLEIARGGESAEGARRTIFITGQEISPLILRRWIRVYRLIAGRDAGTGDCVSEKSQDSMSGLTDRLTIALVIGALIATSGWGERRYDLYVRVASADGISQGSAVSSKASSRQVDQHLPARRFGDPPDLLSRQAVGEGTVSGRLRLQLPLGTRAGGGTGEPDLSAVLRSGSFCPIRCGCQPISTPVTRSTRAAAAVR